ncbi:rhomboid-domain-containing protein, partial [Mollisia scopiformis]
GLPFRDTPISRPEAVAIFGNLLDANTVNRLLRFIHGRRVAGTLGDPSLSNPYDQQAFEAGLEWLRKHVPVDEVECAGLRAELELAEMEGDVMAKAQRAGLYEPNSQGQKDVYGKSGLDAIRRAKEKEFDEREARKKAQLRETRGIEHKTGMLEELSARSQVELRRPGEDPRLKYYLERAKVLPDTPPEMSKFQRLWPSGLVVLAFVTGCSIFATVYTPPKKEWRLWPDIPPAAATIIGLIFANAIVLGAWRVPALFRMLNKNFITVPGYPFAKSMIGSMFSHQQFSHFALNMGVLWFVGIRLHEDVGRGTFLAIYLSSGAVGTFTSLAFYVLRNNFTSSSLGASGALCGIVAAYLLMHSAEKVTFWGVPPDLDWLKVSTMTILSAVIAMEVFHMIRPISKRVGSHAGIDHWAHLGGYAAGIVGAEVVKAREQQRK